MKNQNIKVGYALDDTYANIYECSFIYYNMHPGAVKCVLHFNEFLLKSY